MEIADWLRELSLERYAETFRDNAIDVAVLPELTESDLEKLGVLLGHRKIMLRAIAALRGGAAENIAQPVPTSAPIPGEAERRQLTVMFCDLVGSTLLSTRFDPEDLREIVGAYHRCVADTVAGFAGFVSKYMGDGCLSILVIHNRTKTMPSGPCGPGSPSSTRSADSRPERR